MREQDEGRPPMAARSALPPVVVLLDSSISHELRATAPLSFHRLRDAIADLDPFLPRDAWEPAIDAAAKRAEELAVSLPVLALLPEATSPIQTYFRLRFVADDAANACGHLAALIARTLRDLRDVPMAAADLTRLRDGLLVLTDRDGIDFVEPPI